MDATKPLILFVCTGNYYRSRFAEHWFAHLVEQRGLGCRTDSAGLRVDFEQKTNVGPMSTVAHASLVERGVNVPAIESLRMPRDLTAHDLSSAYRVVLLDEPEHRPMMRRRFPDWEDRVTYWRVVDVQPSADFHPMDAIDPLVVALVDELAGE
ncbi:MAG: low molecular weight phosphatase family protein [Phycisphaeraceae bacterium]